MSDIAKALKDIKAQITDTVDLIAVSKQQPLDRIQSALDAGHRSFGENRVQDAEHTWGDLKSDYDDLTLHLIGPLQSNKAAQAVALFDVIHTIDRPKIAKALKAEMDKQDRHLPCFVQVNTGNEDQKSGVSIDDLGRLLDICVNELGLNIIGLMCIPTINEAPALHFALLNKYSKQYDLQCLSMGMSNDYDTALNFGATHIRVGSKIFGARALI